MKNLAAHYQTFDRRFGGGRRAAFGVEAMALLELVVFFAIAFAIDIFLLEGDRMRGIEPHPFWIAVILLSVQYGATEGLAAALASTAALLLGALPEQTFGQDLYDYLRDVTALPLMWCVAAIIIGELANRRRRRLTRTERALAETREEADGLAEAYAGARQVKDKLEARLAGELRTTLALYEGARAVERTSSGDVLRGAVDLMRGVLGPEKFSVFLLNGDLLEAAVQEGWSADDPYERCYGPESAIHQAVIGHGKLLCVAYGDDARLLGSEGVLAAPLFAGPTGHVVGMVKVEALAFSELTTTAIENFRLCADWIGAALERARRQEALAAGQVTGGGETLSAALYAHEVELMTRLGTRFGFDCAELVIEAEAAHLMTVKEREAFAGVLSRAASETLRTTDLVFDLGRQSRKFAVLLPGADGETAAEVAGKLERALARIAETTVVSSRISVRARSLEMAA